MSELREWLEGRGLGRYAETFERNDIDAIALGELTDRDLAELGVTLGHRRAILGAIRRGDGPGGVTTFLGSPSPASRVDDGQRRHVTVLFADVAGYTTLSERLDPESVHEVMSGCFSLMAERINRYEGTVTHYAGDGLMAVFGAPVAQEDHAARAAHTALDIQEAMADYGREVEERTGMPFRVRIALNTGLVVMTHLDTDARGRETALGDTVNLAARLQALAEAGEVYASERTRRHAGDREFEWAEAGIRTVRGRSAPVRAYRLVRRHRAPRRWPRLAGDAGLTPFIGRTHELEVLSAAWVSASAGAGRVVSVVGEAGLGKSRLLLEFTRRLSAGGGRFVVGTCFTYGGRTPFQPFLDVVRELCGIGDGEGPLAKAAIDARLRSLGLPVEDLAPYLHSLLSYDVENDVLGSLTPELIRHRTVQALTRLLLAQADARPLALIIEDAHWIDGATEEVVGALVERGHGHPLLLVLAYRPEYLNRWRGLANHAEVHLQPLPRVPGAAMVRALLLQPDVVNLPLTPLSPAQTLRVVRRILGGGEVAPELEQAILRRTDGNPLFVEALTRALLEAGAVTRRDGVLSLARPFDELDIPTSLQGVLLARVDRLPPDLRRTLRLAATIGRVFSVDVLTAASREPTAVRAHLARLRELGFISRTGQGRVNDYSFNHVLTQEAVYSTLLAATRAILHGAVGRALEDVQPNRIDENAEILARHFDEAKDHDRTVRYLVIANEKARRANAVVEASAHLLRVRELLQRLPPTPARQRTWIRLLCNNVIVLQLQFRYEECQTYLREALPVAESLGPDLEGIVLSRLGHMEWALCDLPRARSRVDRCLTIWGDGHNPKEFAATHVLLGWVKLLAGELTDIPRVARLALAGLRESFDLRWLVWTRSFASLGDMWMGRWTGAVAHAERGLSVAQEYDDTSLVSFALWTLGMAHAARGDLELALDAGARSVAAAPTPSDRSWAEAANGWFIARAGRPAEAIPALEQAVAANRSVRFVWGEVLANELAEAYLLAGRLEDARATLDETAARCAAGGMTLPGAIALRLTAEVEAVARDDADRGSRALDAYRHAIVALGSMRMRPELALAHAGLGRLLVQLHGTEAGSADLQTAQAIMRELGTRDVRQATALALPAPGG